MSVSDMEEKLYSSLADITKSDYPGSLVTHFSATVCLITDDGTEMVVMLDRPGQSIWQSMGLSEMSAEMRSAMVRGTAPSLSDEDDDEL